MVAVVLTQNLVTAGIVNPLTSNAGQICYQTFTRGITPTVSGTGTGYYAGALANSLTAEFWQPDSTPGYAYWDFAEAKQFSYVAIGAHTIGSSGCSVSVEISNDASVWTSVGSHEPDDDTAIIFYFGTVSARYMRVSVDGVTPPVIGVVYCGVPLEMQRGLYGGHSPVTMSPDIKTYPIDSESGQWLGHSVVYRGFKSSASWKHLTAAWVREYFEPFRQSAINYPFFFAWRPLEFPNEVGLCRPDATISPTNMGLRDFMEVSVNLNAYGAR